MSQSRECTDCKLTFPITEFRLTNYAKLKGGTNRYRRCRLCENKKNREHYRKTHNVRIEAIHKYKQSEKGKSTRAAWIANNKPSMKRARRKHHLKKTFGLTLAQFEALKEQQGNVCAICLEPPKPIRVGGGVAEDLYVDHGHLTGMVRGLLCHKCNTLIGHAGEKIEVLRAAIAYLNRFRSGIPATKVRK